MIRLENLFVSEVAMKEFQENYLSYYKKEVDPDLFGWDAVAEDISETLGQGIYEVGDFVNVEMSLTMTKSGNPELIHVGQLVEVPVPDPDFLDDPDFNDDTGYIGDYVGDYKFSN